MRPITLRQRECLELIKSSVRERGFPPSHRELAELMGIRGLQAIAQHMGYLQDKGFLIFDFNLSRGLRLLPKAFASGEVVPPARCRSCRREYFGKVHACPAA